MAGLSLLEHCIPCKSACCIAGDGIGSPILDKDERDTIERRLPGSTLAVDSPGGIYYLLREQDGSRRCIALTPENRCALQDVKPLDCLCYPLKVVYSGNELVPIADPRCQATPRLTPEFRARALEIAEHSARRFPWAAYEHWMAKCELWAR